MTVTQAPRASGQGVDQRLFPQRPKRATGVKLAGQMQESAFENPPWMLEREGAGYVQVTELLYRVAEHADGQHTVEEIAEAIGHEGNPVNPQTVKLLIAQMLIPRGLIEMADGTTVNVGTTAAGPLQLNMRMKMISPEAISPITQFLKFLYWPPVLVCVLLAAAIAEGWLYFMHGVGSGLHDAIYTPGLMLVVLAVIVFSAAFHELGHAAALHYGGGRIKGMGAGIYVVYPAFYTDVSDNYRLPRWSRVRTDLGGFYFNLIFALAIMGVYLATGHEFLLLMVLMINLEIIHQLLPFLRLDGYWTLADVTGVPDFFSQMTAFVRSVLPIKGMAQGRKLPPLKWWGKVVFAAYMLVTIPLLILLLIVMIRSVPRVLATAWDSLGQQAQTLVVSQANGDLLGMFGSAGQALLLAIPILGLVYTLYSLGRRFITGLWRWSRPSFGRRLIAIGSYAVLGAFLALTWIPQVRLPGQEPGGALAAGPLQPVEWQPIQPNERGTVSDAVAGVVVTREPVATTVAPPPSTTAPTAAPASTAGSTPALPVVPDADARATPAATRAATAATPGSTAVPTAATPAPGARSTPTAATLGTPSTPAAVTTPARPTPTRTPTPVR